jgi:uncharacterized protein YkwD
MKICLMVTLSLMHVYSFSIDTLKVEEEIFNKINSYRVENGKSKLKYSSQMVQACRNHSIYMSINGKLEHVKSLREVNASAEIIQYNYTLGRTELEIGQDVLDIFIESLPHKKIIDSDYKEISVGVHITADEDIWVTIRFN